MNVGGKKGDRAARKSKDNCAGEKYNPDVRVIGFQGRVTIISELPALVK